MRLILPVRASVADCMQNADEAKGYEADSTNRP